MKIISIETSCDETSIALLESTQPFEYTALSHTTISQINIHSQYGGVFPMLARREHELNLIPIFETCLKEAGLFLIKKEILENKIGAVTVEKIESILDRHEPLKVQLYGLLLTIDIEHLKKEIDAVAVTSGPGLPPALWVGVNFARALAAVLGKPLYPVNHMEGHIVGGLASSLDGKHFSLPHVAYPILSLLISGGHTELILSKEPLNYQKVGETLDDAVGECYDKVARMLSLPYPGGPEISRLASLGRERSVSLDKKLPRPLIHSGDLNFSFSGLKTAVLYYVRDFKLQNNTEELSEGAKIAIATEFEEAVKDVLCKKLEKAIFETGAKTIVVGGGVAANTYLRKNFEELSERLSVSIHISSKELSTDNALMIALCAAVSIDHGIQPSETIDITADSSLSF